ncbi:leucine-rich repeat protein [Plasmodium cynomolgi strain B]|uniref:Leucine-rich repeat protein n=1 Tax=Plasmodium cynomolgi (strain B) TaxID=1120755 RepID=K6VIU5_PLACD|nr:leucine-rich repeat protein [Plasmodium cynomolgi strain B]GAB69312.1 leucine-rich repeat protein [Plasmodium cynomolgi strain B]
MSHKIKLRDNVMYATSPMINEDDIADFVSNMNVYKWEGEAGRQAGQQGDRLTGQQGDRLTGQQTDRLTSESGGSPPEGSAHPYPVKEIQLGSLKISDWGMSILIPCVLRSSNLVTLDLSSNDLTNDSAKILAKCLKYLPRLVSLNLSNNLIKSDGANEIVEEFFSPKLASKRGFSPPRGEQISTNFHLNSQAKNAIKNMHTNVRELDLSDNYLSSSVLLKLSQVISNDNNEKIKLYIKNSHLTDTNLSSFFQKCTHIQNLNISENAIASTLFSDHMKILFTSQLDLKELHLSNICFAQNGTHKQHDGNELLKELVNQLTEAPNLSILSFANNKVNDHGFSLFCEFFKKNKNNITSIDFSNNDISDMNNLSEAIKNKETLKMINLSNNRITDGNLKHFCYDTLSSNLSITEVSLSNNHLTDFSCAYFADALVMQCRIVERSIKLKKQLQGGEASPTMALTLCKGEVGSRIELGNQDDLTGQGELRHDRGPPRGPPPGPPRAWEEFPEIDSQKSTSNSSEGSCSVPLHLTKAKKTNFKNDHSEEIHKLKELITNRHNEQHNFFSCIGVPSLNRASETYKLFFLQEKRRNLIYNKNDDFYHSCDSFSLNCFKGLKYLNISGCRINTQGLTLLINSLNMPYCPLEFLDVSSSASDLTDATHQAFASLIADKKAKFEKNDNFHFEHLPLTVRGVAPTLIPLNDSEDNTDGDSIESEWWNYKQGDWPEQGSDEAA